MSLSKEELEKRIYPQKIDSRVVEKEVADVRAILLTAMEVVVDSVPKGREQSLALTKIEEACHWAVKGIARNQNDKPVIITHQFVANPLNSDNCVCGLAWNIPIHK